MKRTILACAVMALSGMAWAAEALPENGLKAEMEGRWEDAASVYEKVLNGLPGRVDLWERLGDIRARLNQHNLAVKALEEAASLSPGNAVLWLKLSRARAVAGDGKGAFEAAGLALEQDPDNLEALRARAELATWVDDRKAAAEAHRKILAKLPDDAASRLGLARLSAWSGQTDEAVSDYKAYLAQKPEDKAAWMELVKTEGWRGNYPDALDELEQYRQRFGEDRPYHEQQARALAWQGKTTPAIEIASRLLVETPEDVDALSTRAIALQGGNRSREALAELETIRKIRPDAKETADLSRYLLTPQRSSVTAAIDYSKDSDEVRILRTRFEGEYVLDPETRLQAGVERLGLSAHTESGLENRDGSANADYRNLWVGASHRFSSMLAADARVGLGNADADGRFPIYRVGLDIRPHDDWWFRPEIERDLFAVSPRASSNGIKHETLRFFARWSPGTRYVIDGMASQGSFSDGNRRWEVQLAPRRAMWRTQSWNIDLGLSGRWFGFREDLPNGYYDPQRYQRYAVTGFGYWKIDDNNGLSLALSAGIHKDSTMDSYKFSSDLVVEGFFGIFSDWYLRAYASLLSNVRQGSGAYRGSYIGAALTRRF